MSATKARPADCQGNDGLVEARVRRQTGLTVSVYRGDEAGLDTVDGTHPYSTVCEDHSQVICHESLTQALLHATDPMGWCEICNGNDVMDEEDL